jgi:hypothetical protein
MYTYNLIKNLIFIIKYIYNEYIFEKNIKKLKYATIILMCKLLKFDIKLLYYNYEIKLDNKNMFINLIISYKNKIIYFKVNNISRNTNNNNYVNINEIIKKHKKYIGNMNCQYALFIYGEKLIKETEEIILEENPGINIYYNNVDKLPEQIYDKNIIMLTQGILGFICSYYNTDFIFNKLVEKFNNYQLCIYDKYYRSFDNRMKNSYIEIEKNRWNKIKNKIQIVYDSYFTNFTDNPIIIDTFSEIKKKDYKYLKYIWINNFKCLSMRKQIGFGKDMDFFDDTEVYSMPIYGSNEDQEYIKRNWIKKKIKLVLYYIYLIYFIFIITL